VNPWEVFCHRVVAVLLAGDIQAGVVLLSDQQWGVRVYNEARDTRIVWGVNEADGVVARWGWTMVRPDGSTEAYLTSLPETATPEQVAQTIATAFPVSDMDSL